MLLIESDGSNLVESWIDIKTRSIDLLDSNEYIKGLQHWPWILNKELK